MNSIYDPCNLLVPRTISLSVLEYRPTTADFETHVTADELIEIREKYSIPEEIKIVLPSPRWRACRPPIGYGSIYIERLDGGLRFPFCQLVIEILKYYKIALA